MQPTPIPDEELRKISLHKFLYISPFLPHVDREKISLRSFLPRNKNKNSVFYRRLSRTVTLTQRIAFSFFF